MKKFAVILLVLSLTRIGVAYADSTNSSSSQNYFFGTKSAATNLNQVLALLIGPKGDPGPAGVAGKDGLIGMDGKDGKDGKDGVDGKNGLDGAPGAVGVAGTAGGSVLSVAFTGAQGTCSNGGVKFTDGAGKVTYSCNGLDGANGANGAPGAAGSGGSVSNLVGGQGEVHVTGCEADGKLSIHFSREFTGTDFIFKSFNVGDPTVTDMDIHDTCAGKTVSFYLKIKSGSLVSTSGVYQANNIVKCSYTLPAAAGWPTTSPQFTLDQFTHDSVNYPNKACATTAAPTVYFDISEIYTADYTDRIGFEIG